MYRSSLPMVSSLLFGAYRVHPPPFVSPSLLPLSSPELVIAARHCAARLLEIREREGEYMYRVRRAGQEFGGEDGE